MVEVDTLIAGILSDVGLDGANTGPVTGAISDGTVTVLLGLGRGPVVGVALLVGRVLLAGAALRADELPAEADASLGDALVVGVMLLDGAVPAVLLAAEVALIEAGPVI